ncbi:hypothetical protein [Brunnivagina elsteri]|uniref:Uncharacterized protein n=1 Tax=Brunnivagina elsteri CCALA 953 TaxID=987040 RepID=A0A2A2TFK6_9CYAN|nr:hypothetical protein [Calothrix elsteri]PAX52456.1 hypothetical protein CK510_19275 [Calothrix elsteri CCALA 953]
MFKNHLKFSNISLIFCDKYNTNATIAIAWTCEAVYLTGGSFSSMPTFCPISRTLFVKSAISAIGVATTVAAVSKAARRFLSLGKQNRKM